MVYSHSGVLRVPTPTFLWTLYLLISSWAYYSFQLPSPGAASEELGSSWINFSSWRFLIIISVSLLQVKTPTTAADSVGSHPPKYGSRVSSSLSLSLSSEATLSLFNSCHTHHSSQLVTTESPSPLPIFSSAVKCHEVPLRTGSRSAAQILSANGEKRICWINALGPNLEREQAGHKAKWLLSKTQFPATHW